MFLRGLRTFCFLVFLASWFREHLTIVKCLVVGSAPGLLWIWSQAKQGPCVDMGSKAVQEWRGSHDKTLGKLWAVGSILNLTWA